MRSMNHFNDGDSDEKYTDEETSGEEDSQKPSEGHIMEDIELYRNISVMAAGVQRFEGSTALLGSSSAYIESMIEVLAKTVGTLSELHNRWKQADFTFIDLIA
jgi:hypothetical protein